MIVDVGYERQENLWMYHPMLEPIVHPMLKPGEDRRLVDEHRQATVGIQYLNWMTEILGLKVEEQWVCHR